VPKTPGLLIVGVSFIIENELIGLEVVFESLSSNVKPPISKLAIFLAYNEPFAVGNCGLSLLNSTEKLVLAPLGLVLLLNVILSKKAFGLISVFGYEAKIGVTSVYPPGMTGSAGLALTVVVEGGARALISASKIVSTFLVTSCLYFCTLLDL